MPVKSFRDPVTQRLKAWGMCDANAPGDLVRVEPDGFHLEPGQWEWTGAQWAPVASATLAAELAGTQRALALTFLESPEGTYKLLRAAFDVARDEINILRQWNQDFKSEVAAAASLADLKNRISLLPNLPDRTLLQFKTAVENKISGGSVDMLTAQPLIVAAPMTTTAKVMAAVKNFFIG